MACGLLFVVVVVLRRCALVCVVVWCGRFSSVCVAVRRCSLFVVACLLFLERCSLVVSCCLVDGCYKL